MQPNSPNGPMNTLGNEETPLKKELLSLEKSPLQVSQKKETVKEKRSKNEVAFPLAFVCLMRKETPVLMSIEDLKTIYERKKKMKTKEPFHLQKFQNKEWLRRQIGDFPEAVTSLRVTSDEKFIIAGYRDNSIQVFNFETKERIHCFRHDYRSVNSVNVTSDNKFIISASYDSFTIFDLQTMQEISNFRVCGPSDYIRAMIVTADDKFLILAFDKQFITVFDLETKHFVHTFKNQAVRKSPITSLAMTSDNKYLISGSEKGDIQIFDFETKEQVHIFEKAHNDRIYSIALTSDDRSIISSCFKSIRVFDLETKQQVFHFKDIYEDCSLCAIALSANDKYLVAGSSKMSFKVFDFETKQLLHCFQDQKILSSINQRNEIRSLVITSDNSFIICGCDDSSIRVFDLEPQVHRFQNQAVSGLQITSLAVTANSKYLVSGSGKGDIQIFDFETKEQVHTFQKAHQEEIRSIVLTSDNKFIISGSYDQSIKVFDLETKQQVHHFENAHKTNITSLALTSDNKFIISGSYDQSIKVFDLETKQQVYQFENVHKWGTNSVALTSDNRFIISAVSQSIKIFDLETKQQVDHFEIVDHYASKYVFRFSISSIAVTSNNRLIICAFTDSSIRIFDLKTKQQVHHLQNVYENGMVLSPNNRFLISAYPQYHAIEVYDFETKQQVANLFNQSRETVSRNYFPDGSVSPMAVTADSKYLICASVNGKIKVFPLEPMQTDFDYKNAINPSSKEKQSMLIPDASIFNQEFHFVYKGISSLATFNSVDHFLFDNPVEYSRSEAIKYPEICVLPFRWTILHITSVFANHEFIEKMPEYSQFKMPFLVDSLNKTPLHYLVAHKNVVSITVNIMIRYICDYLDDCYLKNPFEFQKVVGSMSSLLPEIFQRIEIKSRQRFLRIIHAKSSLPHNNPAPTFGNVLSQAATFSDSPVLTQETRDKIWNDKGTTQVEFRSNFLHLDYDILSEDMSNMIDCLQNLEGEETFKMPVIMRLIDHLWRQAETPLTIFFALYSAFIIALSVYLTFDDRSLPYEITLLIISVLFTANEFMQIFHLRMSYLKDPWNWLDLAHLLLTTAFLITRIADNDNELARAWISAIIIIFGYIRWISLLKIFKPTRNLIQVVITIVKDMVSFIIIIALIIIAFSLIFLVFNREAGYGDYLYQAYNVMYGPMEIEEDAAWPFSQKLIMAVLAFFLNVVLLNLLISIMGDSYGQVLEMRDRTDALTRLEMISEAVIYKKFFKPNHKTERGHLVYCLPVELEEEDDQNQELENNIIKAMRKTIQENNEESKQEILFLKEKILSSEKNSEVMKNEILSLKTNNEAIKASNEEMKTEISNLKEIILSEFSKLKPSKRQIDMNSNIALKKDLIDDNYPAHPEEN